MRLYNKRNSFKNICGIDLSEKKSRKYISKKCYKEKKINRIVLNIKKWLENL